MTYCHGIGTKGLCPMRGDCYRFTQPAPGRDSFGAMPFDFEKTACDYFVTNIPSENYIRTSAYYAWLQLGRPAGQSEAIWNRALSEAEASLGRTSRG